MTAKENIERTIEVLAEYIETNKDSKDIVSAANAMAKLYSAINADMTDMFAVMRQALEKASERELATERHNNAVGYAIGMP